MKDALYFKGTTIYGQAICVANRGPRPRSGMHHRDGCFGAPDYTREEAQQVVDWLNGQDQPLPLINVADRPYRFPGRELPIMRPMDDEFRVDLD